MRCLISGLYAGYKALVAVLLVHLNPLFPIWRAILVKRGADSARLFSMIEATGRTWNGEREG